MENNAIVVNTSQGLSYLVNISKRKFQYIKPDLENVIFNRDDLLDLDTHEYKYQEKKHKYLLENGFFSSRENEYTFITDIKASQIESDIINLKQLTFEVTDDCNLNCTYCAYGDMYEGYDRRLGSGLSLAKAKNILNYLFEKWSSVNFTNDQSMYISFYGGEPLLKMQLIKDIIEYIENSDVNRKIEYSMTTNGMLLDKHIDYLVNKEFNILISLDGDKKGSGYRLTKSKHPSFDIVYANILKVKETYPEFYEEHVNFNSVLHDKNTVSGLYSFFQENLGKTTNLSPLNNSGIKEGSIAKFNSMYNDIIEAFSESDKDSQMNKDYFIQTPFFMEFGKILTRYTNYFYKTYIELFLDINSNKVRPTGTCSPFGKKMFVTVNGKILPCERISQKFVLGSVDDDKVDMTYESISDKYKSYFNSIMKQCRGCYAVNHCSQCMFYIEDIGSAKAQCKQRMDKDSFYSYIGENLSEFIDQPGAYSEILKNVLID